MDPTSTTSAAQLINTQTAPEFDYNYYSTWMQPGLNGLAGGTNVLLPNLSSVTDSNVYNNTGFVGSAAAALRI